MAKNAEKSNLDVLDPVTFYCEKCAEAFGYWPGERNYNVALLGEFCANCSQFEAAGFQEPEGDLYHRIDLEIAWAQLDDTSDLITMSEPLPIRIPQNKQLVEVLLVTVNRAVQEHGPEGGTLQMDNGAMKVTISGNRIKIVAPEKDNYLLFMATAERGWRSHAEPLMVKDITHGWTIPREFVGTHNTPFLPGCLPLFRFTEKEDLEHFKALYNRSEKLNNGISLSNEPILYGRPVTDSGLPGLVMLDTLKNGEFEHFLIGRNFDFILIDGDSDESGALTTVRETIWFQFVNDVPTH